jgi:hypothetical protein
MTTIDLLLSLGDKIADVLMVLLKKRGNKQEKQKAEQLLVEYDTLKSVYTQISALLRNYNGAVEGMVAMGNPQEAFEFCTSEEYQRVRRLLDNLVQNQVSEQRLDCLEVLSVGLTRQTMEDLSMGSARVVTQLQAEAYTIEKWTTTYWTGGRVRQDVVNCYQLIQENGRWRVASSQVFIKAE